MPTRHVVSDRWAEFGLTPLAAMTPPYVALGGPMAAMHVLSPEAEFETVELDARWSVERVQVSRVGGAGEGGKEVRLGEVIVLRDREGSGERSPAVWHPPSRVVEVSVEADGRRTLGLLRDGSLESLEPAEVRRLDASLSRRPPAGRVEQDAMKRRLRNLWELDVWCPGCGAEGHPVLVGMPDPTFFEARDRNGVLQPWPAGSYWTYGCVIGDEPIPGYHCPRCGSEWGHREWT